MAPLASDSHLAQDPTKALMMLPVRSLAYGAAMSFAYPSLLFVSYLRAFYKRIFWGKVTDILKCGGRMWPGDVPYDNPEFYPATWTFSKPFDSEKLKDIFFTMAREAQIPLAGVLFHLEDGPPDGEFHESGPLEADHYLPKKDTSILKEATPVTEFGKALRAGKVLGLRLWNGENGKPTLMHVYLPLNTWDGTSCFNFCKELLSRYNDNEPAAFFKGDKLAFRPEAKLFIDQNTSFMSYLCRQPICLFINLSALIWQLVSCQPCFGGTGFSPEVTYLNFNKEDSAKIVAGAKSKGMKPFAVFSYVAVKAFREVFGEDPYCIVQQSSIQTRHYEPKMERTLVGDWLIGVDQHIGGRKYGHLEAQEAYESLLKDLDELRRPALRALEAKAWGVMGGGASLFEFLPTYNDDNKIMQSVFLNNYGIRTVATDSFHHYNWQAPYRFGFNTICVNGRTSIGIASGVSGLKKLEQAREVIYKTMVEEFMS